MAIPKYRKRMWLSAALAGVATLITGFAIAFSVPSTAASAQPLIILPLLLMVGALALFAGLPWWRQLDDLQKQGQAFSWYWGSTFAALATIICLAVLTGRHSDLTMGAGYMFMAQFAGFAIAFLVWRWNGRGIEE